MTSHFALSGIGGMSNSISLKAKWLVIGYGIWELSAGVMSSGDGIAHYAHLGGMLFGLILILIWRRHREHEF